MGATVLVRVGVIGVLVDMGVLVRVRVLVGIVVLVAVGAGVLAMGVHGTGVPGVGVMAGNGVPVMALLWVRRTLSIDGPSCLCSLKTKPRLRKLKRIIMLVDR